MNPYAFTTSLSNVSTSAGPDLAAPSRQLSLSDLISGGVYKLVNFVESLLVRRTSKVH